MSRAPAGAEAASRITIQHVSFAYPARQTRGFELADVSLSIAEGSITAVLGPNGCGKTTLLKVMAGVLAADRGQVLLDGRPLGEFSRRDVARQIAVVPQETHPAFDYTAALASRSFLTLSGGEKQRVALAGALTQSASTLLLDEPTASLDLGYQLEIATLLKRLNADHGVTIVLATHDLNLAASICTHLVLLRQGRARVIGALLDQVRELGIEPAEQFGRHGTLQANDEPV